MRNPTPQQTADARLAAEALEKHAGNQVRAADSLGIPRSTLQQRIRLYERLSTRDLAAEGVEAQTKIKSLEAEARDLRKRLDKAEQERLDEQEVEQKIFGLARARLATPDWLIKSRPGKSGAGVPCTMWSDWHLGEVVKSAEINGINEYNMPIAEKRLRRLVERTIDLSKNHMTGADYPGIVVNINGDIVSGEIHDELKDTNEDEIYAVVLWAVERIVWGLRTLADQFGRVYVISTFGNHGRQDRKPRAKTRAKRNADWLIGRIVHSHLKADKRFDWNIPLSGDAHYKVFGHRYFTTHGDALGVRGGDGIIGAIGPIMRGEIKTANSESQIGRAYDTALLGHWHQTLWLPRVFVNNCLKGYDEFARFFLRSPPSAPAQSLWFTHPKWGVTCKWEIMLEGAPKASSEPWFSEYKEAA